MFEQYVDQFLGWVKQKSQPAWMALTTIYYEFGAAFKIFIATPLGWKQDFNFMGLNPKQLTDQQKQYDPVFLLHANYNNQASLLYMANTLTKEYPGPIYTANFNHGWITDEDHRIFEDKMSQIKKAYGEQNVTIHLVGISRGAGIALQVSCHSTLEDYPRSSLIYRDGKKYIDYWHQGKGEYVQEEFTEVIRYRSDIGRVILMGCSGKPQFYDQSYPAIFNKFRAVVGAQDRLVLGKPELHQNHCKEIETGHVGLLVNHQAHQQVSFWLNEVKQYSKAKDRSTEQELTFTV